MEVNSETIFDPKEWTRQTISWEELYNIDRWRYNHVMDKLSIADGSKTNHHLISIYTSGGSGIGQNVLVRCSCGEGKDVTDYDRW